MRNSYFGIARSIVLVVAVGVGFNMLGGLILVILYGVDIKGGSPSVLIIVNSLAQLIMMLGLPILIVRAQGKDFFESLRLEGMRETKLGVHLIGIPIIAAAQFFGEAVASLWKIGLSNFPALYDSLNNFQRQIEDMMQGLTTAHNPTQM